MTPPSPSEASPHSTAASDGDEGVFRDPQTGALVYDLSGDGPWIRLDRLGLRLWVREGRPGPLMPYAQLTHVAATARGLWIATKSRVAFVRRSRFARPDGADRLARDLGHEISRQPDGLLQLARMAEIDHRAAHPRHRRVTPLVLLACLAAWLLQLSDPFVTQVGSFVPDLVAHGEWWRLWTANLLHGGVFIPIHLGFNALGLVILGLVVERVLGGFQTAVILLASGLGAMIASALAGYGEVVGASGLVAGLAGAALAVELRHGAALPAWWRLPRRLLIGVILAQGVVDAVVPVIAGAAHLGGLVAGLVAAWPARVGPPGDDPRLYRYAAVAALLSTLGATAAATPLFWRQPEALASHGRHLLQIDGVPPTRLNDLAWRMATESAPGEREIDVARDLAERAVEETGRREPNVLDTLAEVLFAAGDAQGALAVIDEAIALAPGVPYFEEQRRRFTGERDPGDRPAPPALPWFFRPPPPPIHPEVFEGESIEI